VKELAEHTFWVYRALNFTAELTNKEDYSQWVQHHLNEVQQWAYYEACQFSLGQSSHKGGRVLNQIIAITEMHARSSELEVKHFCKWHHPWSP
jgi:exonuclease I